MKSKQLLVVLLAISLAGCAVFGKRRTSHVEKAPAKPARIEFVEKADANYLKAPTWAAKGSKKARAEVYERVRDLTGLPLAQALADAGASELALTLERLRNVTLEREALELGNLPQEEKGRRLNNQRILEERTTRKIQEVALDMKLALFASLLR